MPDQPPRSQRKAVNLLVQLKYPDVGTFIEKYAINMSEGGMFIHTRNPKPVDSFLQFKIELAGGVRVLQGSAKVKWIREPGDPRGPPGMGLHFEQLDVSSQVLVEKMLGSKATARAAEPSPPSPPAAAIAPVIPAIAPVAPAAPSIPVAPKVAALSIASPPAKASPPRQPPPQAPAKTPPPAALVAPPPESAAANTDTELQLDDELRLDLEDLVAQTPELDAPVADANSLVDEPAGDSSASTDSSESSESSPFGFTLDLETSDAPALATPAPSLEEAVGPDLFGADDLLNDALTEGGADNSSSGLELELELDDRRPGKSAPADTKAAKKARAEEPPPDVSGPLPQMRRDRPAADASATTGPVMLTAPAATAKAGPTEASTPDPDRPVFLKPPAQLGSDGPVIGIDLGTTNSCVAVLSKGKPVVLKSKDGYNTIPSVISLSNLGKLMVGRRALQQMILQPTRTVYGAKRLVGRGFQSATVRQVRERFHYEIIADKAGRAAVRIAEHGLTLEEVQGLILTECKEMAEQQLGAPVQRAVVTCPAYYSELQREAVRRAGAMAGLKVERILNEPTAAALAYGVGRNLQKKVLVYDLGGGTFDATLLRIDKNVFEVLATGGDIFLGGVDFDNQIVDFLMDGLQKEFGVDLKTDPVVLSRIADAAERAKIALSERSAVEVHVPMLTVTSDGKPIDLKRMLTRVDLNTACEELVDRTIDVVKDVLLDAKLKAEEIDDIILVGGQSRMRIVRDKLFQVFKKQAQASVNADEAVALGAALYTNTLDKVSSVVLIDVVPMTIGIGQAGGSFRRVIERNTALPATASFKVPTVEDQQRVMELSVFQGEDHSVAGNEYLGTVRIEGLPPMPKGAVQVAVTLRLDSECVLHVEAQELLSRKKVQADLSTRYSPEEVQQRLGVKKEKAAEIEAQRAADLKKRSGRFWGFLKKVIGR